MSEETTFATIRASVEQFQDMIRESAMSGDDEHDDLYLNITEDSVEILQTADAETVLTYSSFDEDYFDVIELEKELQTVTGERNGSEYEYEVGAEAILNVDDTETYLNFASEGGTVELTFTGSEEHRLSTFLRAEGALEAWVKLSGGEAALDRIPHWIPSRFDDEDVYLSPGGKPAPTQIQLDSERIGTIVNAVEESKNADAYPIVVENGEFRIDVGDEYSSGVRGVIPVDSIEGPDVENYYDDGFTDIFSVLSGSVSLQTGPGNNPMAIVKRGDHRVIRHVNGSVNVS